MRQLGVPEQTEIREGRCAAAAVSDSQPDRHAARVCCCACVCSPVCAAAIHHNQLRCCGLQLPQLL
jgi:hypothetical protein